jgi:hypothetical protein
MICPGRSHFHSHVVRMQLKFCCFLDNLVHMSGFWLRCLSCSWIQWPKFMLFSAIVDFCGW